MTDEELGAQLRLQAIDQVSDAKNAYIEHDGRVSVIQRQRRRANRRGPARSAVSDQQVPEFFRSRRDVAQPAHDANARSADTRAVAS